MNSTDMNVNCESSLSDKEQPETKSVSGSHQTASSSSLAQSSTCSLKFTQKLLLPNDDSWSSIRGPLRASGHLNKLPIASRSVRSSPSANGRQLKRSKGDLTSDQDRKPEVAVISQSYDSINLTGSSSKERIKQHQRKTSRAYINEGFDSKELILDPQAVRPLLLHGMG
nr:hypothetical protein BgiMline_032501 [Biomphalaria glabrata]